MRARARSVSHALLLLLALSPTALAQIAAPVGEASSERSDTRDGEADTELVITATRHAEEAFWIPQATTLWTYQDLGYGGDGRSLPNTLTREPSVLMQKTGPGQSSPYIRGLTGFRTLMLVDGVRLNNSVWRSGPNQYTGTLDANAFGSLELVRGPGAVLWGSDAMGGTIHARTAAPDASQGWFGTYGLRYSTAERSASHRLEVEGGVPGEFAVRFGVTDKSFGNIMAGSGSRALPNTAYDERDLDVRVDVPLQDDDVTLTFVAQKVSQDNVPRTHKTVEAVPFHGTSVGSEIRRDLDQDRELVYAKLAWRAPNAAFYDDAEVTVSWQSTEERQDRLRTGARRDLQGFDVDTVGGALQFSKGTDHGLLTYGADFYHDEVSSFRRDYVNGVFTGPQIQGPVADDASYDLLGVFVQDEIEHAGGTTTVGLRYSRASAEANRVDNPNVGGSNPSTPGNVLRVNETFSELVASVRTLVPLDDQTNAWFGVSQAFRAPNLSDLTSELEDSGIESPTPDLDSEKLLGFEAGVRTQQDTWEGEAVVYYNELRDFILNSPTGQFVGGTPVVQKSNVGDGRVFGMELRGELRLTEEWSTYASGAYMDSSVQQFTSTGAPEHGPLDREAPLSGVLGAALQPHDSVWRYEGDVFMAHRADDLSIRDTTDTERIPPGGTPGYAVWGVRARRPLGPGSFVGVALENLFNRDFRIHGSGQNEPGRNLVISYRKRFGT
ncbi:MAG: hypothetical protein DHS20C15_25060 [Planctomycetota bacterium]|nr:MAG: hypothetical protein DHS20C15_25060 [Planctomycetota bacterium]